MLHRPKYAPEIEVTAHVEYEDGQYYVTIEDITVHGKEISEYLYSFLKKLHGNEWVKEIIDHIKDKIWEAA